MRSMVLAICMAVLLGPACALGTASPTTTLPSTTLPSPTLPTPTPAITRPDGTPACGGFHLGVINDTDESIDVAINGIHISTIIARSSVMLIEMFISEQVQMPWTVVATRSADGTELGRAHYDSTEADQTMVVSAANVRTAATEPCPNIPVRPPA